MARTVRASSLWWENRGESVGNCRNIDRCWMFLQCWYPPMLEPPPMSFDSKAEVERLRQQSAIDRTHRYAPSRLDR